MIISEKLCKKITTTLVENNLIDPYLYDAYYYCFDFLLDILLFASIIIFIGILSHNFLLSIIYLIILIPLKSIAGGAHATTPFFCGILSYTITFICIFLSKTLPFIPIINLIISFIICIIICILAPIEPQNKKYTIENRIKAKKICIILSIFIYLFLLIMLILKKSCFANLTMMCIIITVINQIIGLHQRNGGTNNDSEYCHMR